MAILDFFPKIVYTKRVSVNKVGDKVATLVRKNTTKTPTRSRKITVTHSELRELIGRRARSSFPLDARTERAYWLRQIRFLMGEEV